ncbi:hypothetical protein ACQUQU_11125 [Thalassolituus sp. LLYu03]|uniref:hypothetical protein n=1 Tax=Thalassolituus sp. LLYu03 TaxID=3421656 RepID=UPI003D2CAD1B
MKHTLIFTLLAAAQASAATLDCSSGWQWLSFAGISQLEQDGDQAIVAGCEWLAPLPPGRQQWPPGLPSLRYEQALPTEVSDSKGYIRYQNWQLDVPLLRTGQIVWGYHTRYDYRQQLHVLGSALSYDGSALTLGQELLLDREQLDHGLYLDLTGLGSPFTRLTLMYSQETRPLALGGTTDTLENATLTGWRIRLERQHMNPGFSLQGYLGLGEETLTDASDARVLLLDNRQLMVTEVKAGVQWLFKRGHVLAFSRVQGTLLYRLATPDASDAEVTLDSFSDLDYGASLGLGLRF